MNDLKMVLLKQDLQLLQDRQDDYLRTLLDIAASMIAREGITLTDSAEDIGLQAMYAAYLYRHRAQRENAMPRMLRYALNNRLLAEKLEDPHAAQ